MTTHVCTHVQFAVAETNIPSGSIFGGSRGETSLLGLFSLQLVSFASIFISDFLQ